MGRIGPVLLVVHVLEKVKNCDSGTNILRYIASAIIFNISILKSCDTIICRFKLLHVAVVVSGPHTTDHAHSYPRSNEFSSQFLCGCQVSRAAVLLSIITFPLRNILVDVQHWMHYRIHRTSGGWEGVHSIGQNWVLYLHRDPAQSVTPRVWRTLRLVVH